ncbi:GGDEF domain-containing protein [Nitrosophilus alvini]|uniref:bifunctional diguanylate cyclase/phosphodiesterase n=1 Tax=Nitrosophilus alvini TaxID=2714855 RepID=UPI00190AB559|nr:GGDEF domain-containing protein [Nitrosophilus alvini]
MLYSEEKERSNRFKLALRIGIPIFLLVFALLFVIFNREFSEIFQYILIFTAVVISVYFIFFMIYQGFSERLIDPISKAFNRKAITDIFQNEIEKNRDYTIVLISVDNIADINERYGIEKGDNILSGVVKIIDSFFKKCCGNKIPIGHYKGGEFLVGLHIKKDDVKKYVDDFLKKYDRSVIDDVEIKLFAAMIDTGYSKDLKKIVERLYELYAKYSHRPVSKRVAVAAKRSMEASEFEKFIIDTIEKKSLSLRFQPALNLKTGLYDMAEVSVKLQQPDGSLIHPSQFIPVVNRLGFEKKFDEILTQKVLEVLSGKQIDMMFSFNISPFSLRDKNFTKNIFNLFEKYPVSKEKIILELYENRLYKDVEYYKKIISLYREEGFKIAYDNFGAYNAATEYIKEIPVDFVHFDKEYTKKINTLSYRVFLRSWTEAFEELGIKSVIKFIDNEELVEIFKNLGVDYVEGYAVARPMDFEELIEFIREKR